MAGIGPAPKPASKRRLHTPPATYGAATPIVAPAAAAGTQDRELGIDDPHPMVVSLWTVVQDSAEARFYSQADWVRLRMELWFADQTLRKPTANAWAQVQHGLNAMLISPADKRRAGIELKPPTPDSDEIAAVSMMSRYRDKINSE